VIVDGGRPCEYRALLATDRATSDRLTVTGSSDESKPLLVSGNCYGLPSANRPHLPSLSTTPSARLENVTP
jgi:hypothetical protein